MFFFLQSLGTRREWGAQQDQDGRRGFVVAYILLPLSCPRSRYHDG